MNRSPTNAGFTLVEIAVAVAIMAVIAALSAPAFLEMRSNLRAKQMANGIASLFSVARAEAIRTRDNHAVFVWRDPNNNALQDAGTNVAALAIRDANADGIPQPSEVVASVQWDTAPGIQFGSTASVAAPTDADPNNDFNTGWTFRDRGGNTSRWVAFGPDGVPRGFSVSPYDDGGAAGIGTGGGGVYLNSGERDYAIVLMPLGGVRVHVLSPNTNAWKN